MADAGTTTAIARLDARLDARLESLEPESIRAQVIVAIRQFRASWIEVGRLLNEVVYGGDYKEWGYDNFEVYCARELGLKKPTVQKLMISYNYMKKYETARLEQLEASGDGAPAPDYQTVELLDRVRRREDVGEEEVERLHRRAFECDGDGETELRKELRATLRPAGDAEAMADAAGRRRTELAGILRLARELRRRLSGAATVPGGLRERLEQALTELEALD